MATDGPGDTLLGVLPPAGPGEAETGVPSRKLLWEARWLLPPPTVHTAWPSLGGRGGGPMASARH